MDNRLQQLTDRIYQEGVAKGEAEAQRIVNSALDEAANVLADAKKNAELILTEAKEKAAEMKENTQAELKMAATHLVDSLKNEVVTLLNDKVSQKSVHEAMSDPSLLKKLIESMLKNWASSDKKEVNLQILIPEKDEKEIISFFQSQTKILLDQGFTINVSKNIKQGFQLAPIDGSYKISFTDQDFVLFFKEFLRPKIAEMLFSK